MRGLASALTALVLVGAAQAQYVPDVGPGRCVANCGGGGSTYRSGGGYTPGPGPDLSALIAALFTLPPGEKAMLEGWQALKAGNTSQAESKFRSAIGHDARLAQAWEGLAEVAFSRGQLDAALKHATKAKSLSANGAPGPRRLIGRISRAIQKKNAPKPRAKKKWTKPIRTPALDRQLDAKTAKVLEMRAELKARQEARRNGQAQAFSRGSVRPEDAGLTDRVVERPGGPQLSATGQLRSLELHGDRARRMVVTPATPHDRVSDRQMWEASRGFDTRGEGMGSLDAVVVDGR